MFLAHLAHPVTYLAVTEHFLWGYVKRRVYRIPPANINELQWQILECIEGFPKETPEHGMTSFPLQLDVNNMMVTYELSYSNSDR
jgi:hypothetical protein